MKILLGYYVYPYHFDVQKWYEDWLSELRKRGVLIDGICLSIDPPSERLSWNEIDKKWKQGDKKLFNLYNDIEEKTKDYDIFVNYNGINLHPEFVGRLSTFNVYSCFDDPESSNFLSKPVARYYDLSKVGNIACLDMYKEWGCRHVEYWPISFRFDSYDHSLTEEKILNGSRTQNISLLCERQSRWRRERLDKFYNAFPNEAYYGPGWPNGFLDEKYKISLYQNTKIGINIHNSIGPVNFRTFEIPANGAMLLCDNKSNLGKLYELGKEAVGFDTMEEAIDLSNYYLAHEEERVQVALNGWKKAMKEYNSVKIFEDLIKEVKSIRLEKDKNQGIVPLQKQRIKNRISSFFHY